jgi:hypothetical protein
LSRSVVSDGFAADPMQAGRKASKTRMQSEKGILEMFMLFLFFNQKNTDFF